MNKNLEDYCLIEGKTATEKEKNLQKKIEEIEIFYCDEKYQKRSEDNKIKFSDILFKESEILRKILSFWKVKYKEEGKVVEIKKEIDKIYNKNIKERKITEGNRSDYFLSRIGDYKELEDYLEEKEIKAGVLPESQTKADVRIDFLELSFSKAEAEEFRRIGLSADDEVVEFAFGDIFPGKEKFSEDVFKTALSKMAEFLKNKRPECSAVYAESWLFDGTKWGDLLGFHVFKDKILYNNWGQFVDKYSNVNLRRLKRMIDSGEMPYKNYFGYLKTEDFIERFLQK